MWTDINYSGFIFNKTPKVAHKYIKLMRLDRPIGTWLLLFPCLWSSVLAEKGFSQLSLNDYILFTIFALGALLMRSAGCIINDLWDKDLDSKVERTKTRPLASGEISTKRAFIVLSILLLLSLKLLLILNTFAIIVGLISILPVIIYPLMKRITYLPQMVLGLTFNWGALLGWAAIKGSIDMPAILLYIGGMFWTLAYDTFYAHQDKEDDELIGIKSTALMFGDSSRTFISIFYAIAIICFASAKVAYSPSIYLIPCVLLAAAHCIYITKTWEMDEQKSSLTAFKANKLFALIILGMMGL